MNARSLSLLVAIALGATTAAQAASYVSPTSLVGGPAINFDDLADGTIVSGQYAGVVFSQPGGGLPQIDKSPFIWGYAASSGIGVLIGSADAQASVPGIAGIIATFSNPVSYVEAFLGDWAPLGGFTVSVFGSSGLLESIVVPASAFPTQANPNAPGGLVPPANPGVYVGFTRNTSDILSVQFGPGPVVANSADAFAIDDLRFPGVGAGVPDGGNTALLLGTGLLLVASARRRFPS
jgi:hypothetical protein